MIETSDEDSQHGAAGCHFFTGTERIKLLYVRGFAVVRLACLLSPGLAMRDVFEAQPVSGALSGVDRQLEKTYRPKASAHTCIVVSQYLERVSMHPKY